MPCPCGNEAGLKEALAQIPRIREEFWRNLTVVGAADTVTTKVKTAVADADLVVMCTPVQHIISVLPEIMAAAKP